MVADHDPRGEPFEEARVAALTERAGAGRVAEEIAHDGGNGAGVAGLEEHAGDAVLDHVGNAPGPGRGHRKRQAVGLEGHLPELLLQ